MILEHGGVLKVTKNKLQKWDLIMVIMIGKLFDFLQLMMQVLFEEDSRFSLKTVETVMV